MKITKSDSNEKFIHCCKKMNEQIEFVCEAHPEKFDCPDNLIFHSKNSDEFGLIIHDGGSSFMKIDFCPFCGKNLAKND